MINIVIGKPGSGKTYHMVRYLFDLLADLIKKKDNERTVYTNISVNIDEFNRQLSAKFGQPVDISGILVILGPEDLKFNPALLAMEDRIEKRVAGKSFYSVAATSKAFFWNRFPDDALIMIDEIQKYLSTVKEESESEKQSLIEYFSLHRHRKHDWYFITQNLLSLPVEIRRVSEKVYDIFNAKSMSIGFPINIPMRDVEILLAGFNVSRQVYRVREGYLESTYRVSYDDSVEVVVMEKRVFALYQTHTQLAENQSASIFKGDSALPFDLGKGQRLRAVAWFLKKHGFHLGVKLILVCWFFGGIFIFLYHHSAGYLAKQKELTESQEKIEASDGELHQLADRQVNDENSDAIYSEDDIIPAAIQCSVIFNQVYELDGVRYNPGDIVSGRRIVSISARDGVIYELPELQYLRDFDFLAGCSRWLSLCRANARELASDSTGN